MRSKTYLETTALPIISIRALLTEAINDVNQLSFAIWLITNRLLAMVAAWRR